MAGFLPCFGGGSLSVPPSGGPAEFRNKTEPENETLKKYSEGPQHFVGEGRPAPISQRNLF